MTLGELKDLLQSPKTVKAQFDLIADMFRIMQDQVDEIDTLHKTNLEHARQTHEVALAWLLSFERPEIDMREAVVTLERDLTLSIAKLEEHIL